MRLDDFLVSYSHLVCTDYDEAEFAAMRVLCPGLSSAKLGKILNYACRLLEGNEIYLEIGTFTGYTLVSASHANSIPKFIGIDNFSIAGIKTDEQQRLWIRDRLKINLEHFGHPNRKVIDGDFRDVALEEGTQIGVFYIDGKHDYDEVIANFTWGEKYLADRALIAIDDITIAGVGEGVSDWVKDHPEYQEFFRMNIHHNVNDRNHWHPTFWNGLSLVSFRRNKEKK